MQSILLISAFLAFFLSFLVFSKKRKTYSDYLLAFWLLFMVVHTVAEYLEFYNHENNYPMPWLIGIKISFPVIHSIWVYLYILSYTHPEKTSWKLLWHLAPVVVLNLILLETFFLKSDLEKIRICRSAFQGSGILDKGLEWSIYLIYLLIVGYLLAGYRLLQKHAKKVRNHFSNLKGLDLKWLRVLLYSIGIVLVVSILLDWIIHNLGLISPDFGSAIVFTGIAAGIFYVGFHGIRQTAIFLDNNAGEQKKSTPLNFKKRYVLQAEVHSQPPEQLNSHQYERLTRFMEEKKPYLDSDLNLTTLAGQLGYKPHVLSQLINQKTGKNFFDFVNSYRIDEFKERIRQPDNQAFTLLSVAFDCGFNSKSTFNRVFKNHTGYTPSEFSSKVGSGQ